MTGESVSAARPSPGYLYALSAACIGLSFMGLGLGGALLGRAGADPIGAFDVDGMVAFLLAFAIIFATRLLFWPHAPSALRSGVRIAVTAIFVLAGLLALTGLVLALSLPPTTPHASFPVYVSILAVLFQAGAVWWIMRYRNEGL